MIAVIVPVLGRPKNAAPLAESLAHATTLPHRLVFVCSPHDPEQVAACDDAASEYVAQGRSAFVLHTSRQAGPSDFAHKINLAVRFTEEPWVFQAADDVRFEPGWDTALMDCAEATGALVIGTDDGGNPTVIAGKHSTHTLIARSYIEDPGASMDGPGSAFSTAYGHQYVDTELCQLAMSRGVWAFCKQARVTHLHPFWVGRNRTDDTYRKGLATSRQDARIYAQRSRMWTRGRTRV